MKILLCITKHINSNLIIFIIASKNSNDNSNIIRKHLQKKHFYNYSNHQPTKTNVLNHDFMKIIAFGDSLTEGMHSSGYGGGFAPYTTKLEELLNTNNKGKQYQIVNDGISGQCVFMEMSSRLPISIQENSHNLKLVIILGGTNDLLTLDCDKNVNLTKEIINLHTIAHSRGYKTIMVTIPEANIADASLLTMPYETFHRLWYNTNQSLRQYAQANQRSTTLCDLAKKFPMHSLDLYHKAFYWSDDLHPTPQGYEKMAYILYETILKINL